MKSLKLLYKGALLGLLPEMVNSGFELADTAFVAYEGNLVYDIFMESTFDESVAHFRMLSLDGYLYTLVFTAPEENVSARDAFFGSLQINAKAAQFKSKDPKDAEDEKKKEKKVSRPEAIGRLAGPLAIVLIIIGVIARRNRKKKINDSTDF